MITINGKKFAESEAELTASVFTPGGTPVGFAKRSKRKIELRDLQGNIVGAVASGGVIATASMVNGKPWYGYGWPKILGKEPSLSAQHDDIQTLKKGRDARGYYFKGAALGGSRHRKRKINLGRTREADIMFETPVCWVRRGRSDYTVFRTGGTHSTSDSSYHKTPDGLSIAIARCKYLAKRK
jgi:hypothetical protein